MTQTISSQTRGDGKDGIACLHAGEARPRGEAVAEEIYQNRDGRELHELEEHEDGHGGEGALVLIEAEADGVRRVDDEGNGGDAEDAEEEDLQREEQRLPLQSSCPACGRRGRGRTRTAGPPANH